MRRRLGDPVYRGLLALLGCTVFAVLALIVVETVRGAGHSLAAFDVRFLTATEWDPVA